MKDTAFWVPREKLDRFAANYRRGPDKKLQLIDDPEKSSYLQGADVLLGRRRPCRHDGDYWRFCEMLRRGGELDGARILGPRTIELMHRNHLKDGKDLTADGDRRLLRDGQ